MWGFHLCLDIAKCKPSSIRCKKTIETFTTQLVHDIDMVAFGKPQIVHFGSGNKAGYTLIQLIETSNISAHFCEETNGLFLDVFSCKPYDTKVVIDVVNKHFEPAYISMKYMERDLPTKDTPNVIELA